MMMPKTRFSDTPMNATTGQELKQQPDTTSVPLSFAIRDETDDDASQITELTIAAFKSLEISNHTEQFIIDALRSANALTVSLVATVNGRVVGHIAFSPVTISDGTQNWYGLGPLSVLPELQRRGIGGALILEGMSRLRKLGAGGCCLVGHPEYYTRFGFKNTPGLLLEGVPVEVFFAQTFGDHTPQGRVDFHSAFRADNPGMLPATDEAHQPDMQQR